jgi:hypothetical protein
MWVFAGGATTGSELREHPQNMARVSNRTNLTDASFMIDSSSPESDSQRFIHAWSKTLAGDNVIGRACSRTEPGSIDL